MKTLRHLGIIILVATLSLQGFAIEDTKQQTCLGHPAMIDLTKTINKMTAQLQAKKGLIKYDSKHIYNIVNDVLVPKADFQIMSRMVLARHWKKLTPQQQSEFTKGFAKLMIKTYGIAFENYNGETIEYKCPVKNLPETGGKKRAELSTILHTLNNGDINIKFRVLEKNAELSKWVVYDIIIDNVSIINSYRQVFEEKFKKQDPDMVIATMFKDS